MILQAMEGLNKVSSCNPCDGEAGDSTGSNPFDSDIGGISTRTGTPSSVRDAASTEAPDQNAPRRPPPPRPRNDTYQCEEITNEKYQTHAHDVEAGAVPSQFISSEKTEPVQDACKEPRLGFFRGQYNAFRGTYCPIGEPPLVLPTCPDDKEKLCYLNMGRISFFSFGILSFFGLGAGMWLFTITAAYFYWFGLFAFINCIYLILSYGIGLIGKDYDYKAHLEKVYAYPITEDTAPTVDIYLPCCHEPLEILENTYRHIIKLDYPASRLKVYVMDDGNLESVRQLAEIYGFTYHVRDDRPHLRKAGNLRWNFARTHSEFFVIFDADFCPRPDFVKELIVEHIADEKVAIVQTPQWFRSTSDQTWVEQGAGATQELFYRVIQVNRDRWGGAICVGTNAMYRRAALEAVGGTADIGHSEDVHTGFGAIHRGWKVRYVPLCLATGICPNSPRALFSQQMRWATGSTTLLSNSEFWRSNLTPMQKLCYFSGFLFYLSLSLNIIIGPLPGVLLLALRPQWVKVWNIAFAIPSYFYGLVVIPLWAKSNYNYNVQHVLTLQSHAYLMAIKDRLFNIDAPWAVSGDSKAHKSDKHRNMRIFCWIWITLVTGSMIGLGTWQLLPGRGLDKWYDPLPLFLFTAYNLYKTHYFMFANW